MTGFPDVRMRDNRKDRATRERCRQTRVLLTGDLIMPLFVKEGISKEKEIKSMPGVYQWPLRRIVFQARRVYESGIPSVILFGIPEHKDAVGSSAYEQRGIVQEAIRAIKKSVPRLTVIADVCLCEYTSHGHCGVIRSPKLEVKNLKKKKIGYGEVDNDATIEVLVRVAVSYAQSGADMVAPSAMMDGQVGAIKKALIKDNYSSVQIMSYSAKYASGFYGPFRDAAESPPQFGDRSTYQMDYHNSDEAVLEARLDIQEGADILMVKPALGYADIIYRLKKELKFPLACYSVSGEYAMIRAAAQRGWLDEKRVVLEVLTGFKRAGADFIITYYALKAAEWLKNK